MIYAIQSGKFVKIGYSKNPKKRLVTIATSSPSECVLLGVKDGTEEDEKLLHSQFASHRTAGEWFELNDELIAWISENMKPLQNHRPKNRLSSSNGNTMVRITVGMTSEQAERFAAYLAEHDIPEQEAARIAIERLIGLPPEKDERERAKLRRGNPNFSK